MTEIRLGNRVIGDGHGPLVIPEIGINHEGEFEKAIQLIDAAIAAGAECVKFQSHITEAEMVPTDMKPGEISDERLWEAQINLWVTSEILGAIGSFNEAVVADISKNLADAGIDPQPGTRQ